MAEPQVLNVCVRQSCFLCDRRLLKIPYYITTVNLPQQALVSSAKTHKLRCTRYSNVTLQLDRKIKRYRSLNVVADSFLIPTHVRAR